MNEGHQLPQIRCVIYRSTSIGDVTLASACFDVLNKIDLPFEVHWVGRQPALSLLQASYPEHHFYEVSDESSNKKVLDELRKLNHVHFVLDLQKSWRSRRFCSKLGEYHHAPVHTWDKKSFQRAKLLLNAKVKGRNQSLSDEALNPDFKQHSQMSHALVQALRKALPNISLDSVRRGQSKPKLDFTKFSQSEPSTAWRNELQVGRWLAIAPGASFPTKKAPGEVFVEILQKFSEKAKESNLEVGLLFLGDDSDRKEALSICDKLNWAHPTLNLCGRLSLVESAEALTYSKGLLSNDSSLGHICEAVGHPVSILFGPTVEGFGFGPWRSSSRSHSVNLGCRPCSKHGRKPCRFEDTKCFKDIDTEKVADHLLSISKGEG